MIYISPQGPGFFIFFQKRIEVPYVGGGDYKSHQKEKIEEETEIMEAALFIITMLCRK